MANYSNFLRLSNGIATNTDLLTDRLLVLNPIVDGYAAFKGGSNYTNLQASASTTNYTFTLPPNGGLSSQFLQTDGNGVTTWAAVSLSPTLQEVYDNDPNGSNVTISTTSTDGHLVIAGSEGFRVTAAQGLVIASTPSATGDLITVPGQSDALIQGRLEVDSTARFDGYVQVGNYDAPNAWIVTTPTAGDLVVAGNTEVNGAFAAAHRGDTGLKQAELYASNLAGTQYADIYASHDNGNTTQAWINATRGSSTSEVKVEYYVPNLGTRTYIAGDTGIYLSTPSGVHMDGYLLGNSFNDPWLSGYNAGDIKTNGNLEIKGNVALVKEVSSGIGENYIDVGDTGLGNYYTELYQYYSATTNYVSSYLLSQDNVNNRIGWLRLQTDPAQPRVLLTGTNGNVSIITSTAGDVNIDSVDNILLDGTNIDLSSGSLKLRVDSTAIHAYDDILPALNDGYDLGSASLQWSDLYISDGIHIASGSGVESTTASATLNVGSSGNTSVLNLGTGSNTNTINIGTGAGATTINLGGAGDTVNVAGTLTYVNTTNLEVSDKLIIVNKNGALASGDTAGIAVEEDGYLEGYAYVGNSRASWDFVAPASDGTFRLTPPTAAFTATFDGSALVDGYTYTLPNADGTLLLSGQVNLVTDVVGILPMSKGGTEAALSPVDGAVVYSSSTELGLTTAGTMGQPLISSGGSGAPGWFTDTGVVKATTGVLSTGNVNLTSEVTGNLPLTNGGTGTSLSAPGGSIIYGNDTALASSTVGTTGQALLSGGASTPTWFTDSGVVKATTGVLSTSNVSLTTEVSGILPLANGGTNKNMTASAGSVVYSDADSLELTSVGTTGQFLKSNGTSAPAFDYVDKLFVTLTNNTGSTLTAGTVVILSQSTAGEIQMADASTLATCEGVAGVVLSNILDGASGYVQVAGRCTPTQDASYDLGKRVYVSETAGSSTKVAPSALNTVIFVLGYAVSTTDIILNMRLEAVN